MKIRIASYNARWPELFEKERKLILSNLQNKHLIIEHIGSTAVPALAAKPVIDMMVGVSCDDALEEVKELLLAQPNYFYCKKYEKQMPLR